PNLATRYRARLPRTRPGTRALSKSMTRVDLRSLVHDQREPEGQETVRRKGDDLCDHAVLDAKNIQRQGAPSGIAGPEHIGSDRWLKVGAGHNAAETAEPFGAESA